MFYLRMICIKYYFCSIWKFLERIWVDAPYSLIKVSRLSLPCISVSIPYTDLKRYFLPQNTLYRQPPTPYCFGVVEEVICGVILSESWAVQLRKPGFKFFHSGILIKMDSKWLVALNVSLTRSLVMNSIVPLYCSKSESSDVLLRGNIFHWPWLLIHMIMSSTSLSE